MADNNTTKVIARRPQFTYVAIKTKYLESPLLKVHTTYLFKKSR